MKNVLCVITIIYGLLSIIVSFNQLKDDKKRISTFIMLLGGIVLIIASCLKLFELSIAYIIATIGAILICIAALINGKKNENIHMSHHIIRFIISCILITGFYFIN